MDFSFLYDTHGIQILRSQEKKSSWLEWFRLRRRKANSDEEINEIHDLIVNVYESMDDQARAVLLSLAKIVQSDDRSLAIEDKIRAIVAMGHSLCCSHIQTKSATQLYAAPLVRALSHQDLRMRLTAMIAIAETAIDNLTFQMKLNEIETIPKLFEIMGTSLKHAGRTLHTINEHSKLVAWSCYTVVNVCTNCMPNILLLRTIVPTQLEMLSDAARLEIWSYIWRENYARTILGFVTNDSTSDSINDAVQPQPYSMEDIHGHVEQPSGSTTSSRTLFSVNTHRCAVL